MATTKGQRKPRRKPAEPKGKPWQFGEGKYLSTVSINRNGVSSGASVDTLRGALGLTVGIYDAEVRERVMAAQADAGLEPTGVVTEVEWDLIVNRVKPDGATPAD